MDTSTSGRRRSSGGADGVGSHQHHHVVASQEAAAFNSLQLLLREDAMLREYGLTETSASASSSSSSGGGSAGADHVAFPYAAALLKQSAASSSDFVPPSSSSGGAAAAGGAAGAASTTTSTKQRADTALQDVERKLALVESLAVKLSRTRPEAVAGHLLRLHGYQLSTDRPTAAEQEQEQEGSQMKQDGGGMDGSAGGTDGSGGGATTAAAVPLTLATIRDRADRLERQANVLDSVAQRVETSLSRGYDRMSSACLRLERVLTLSSTLKSILRIQFESNKLLNYDLDDPRDLSRAAASVAALEELLTPELRGIAVVDEMRPSIEAVARQVRQAAASLLLEQDGDSSSAATTLPQLGATLQVYYHLGELPEAVWKAAERAHSQAEVVARELFNPTTLSNLSEQAKRTAKESRLVPKKLKQVRVEAARKWSSDFAVVALQVRNLQLVLNRKTDPVSRQAFVDVVMSAPIPREFQRQESGGGGKAHQPKTIFALFWERTCRTVAGLLQSILTQDNGRYAQDVAALYPAVRAAALELMGRLQDSYTGAGTSGVSSSLEDYGSGGGSGAAGILGGSSLLDDDFLDWSGNASNDNPQAGSSSTAADVWTRSSTVEGAAADLTSSSSSRVLMGGPSATISLSSIFQLYEWKTLQGNGKTKTGLYPLQQAFLQSCIDRLCAPLQYLFPENVTLDDNGVPISSGMALLPSKYDVQRFDENIRQELSLADPRESGGGDFTAITMIAECVVTMISRFCDSARKAISGVNGEYDYINNQWGMTDALQHDRKVVAIMYAVAKNLKNAPDKTFLAPYRPAISPQYEEAAAMCQSALLPALQDIDKMVRSVILNPLWRAMNRRIAAAMAKMHHGVYIQSGGGGGYDDNSDSPAFVQKYLADVFEVIGQNHLSRFPPDYAAAVAAKVSAFSIYAFVSNASLIRPLGENARLHITQDLADLELSLEQLVLKNGGHSHLSQIDSGKPYAELRAVRQMLFWTGLENANMSAQEASKALLREPWIRDVRPSTIFHYLFSFAPSLLSSPHHARRVKADEYVSSVLVKFDGSDVEDGEDAAWMTTMSCCDSYQQRASSMAASAGDGDPRIPQILLLLGQELMRRRRNQ